MYSFLSSVFSNVPLYRKKNAAVKSLCHFTVDKASDSEVY